MVSKAAGAFRPLGFLDSNLCAGSDREAALRYEAMPGTGVLSTRTSGSSKSSLQAFGDKPGINGDEVCSVNEDIKFW